jgi:ATP-binding cassette subfamily C protein
MTASRTAGAAPAAAPAGQRMFGWLGDILRNSGAASIGGPLGEALMSVRQHFVWAAGFSAVVSILYLSSSLYMMLVYDKVLNSGSRMTLIVLTIALAGALATLAWLDMTRSRLLVRANVRLDRKLSGPVIDTVLRQAASGDTRPQQMLRDMDQFRGVVTGQPALALMDIPWAPVYLIVLFIIHWSLAALAITGGVLFFAVARWSENRMREPTRKVNEQTAEINASLEGALRYAGPIQALGMGAPLQRRLATRRESGRTLSAGAAYDNSVATGILRFLRLLWQSLALGLGAWLAIDGLIAPGAMIAASILLGRTLAPLEQIVGAWKPLMTAADNYERLKSALTQAGKGQPQDLMDLPALGGKVDVENIVVPGQPGAPPILGGVSFTLQPGETVGVVGPSGAGKSTLVRTLMGLAPIAGGAVRLDGADLNQWRRDTLALMTGYLPQDVALLPGTVRDNISRFEADSETPGPDIDSAVIAAAQMAGVHDDILRLPQGYATPIEAGGIQLSGGQKQRIGLARALYRGPRLVVLDEPNAHLDRDGEAALIATLHKLRDDRCTVILVTHRANLLGTAQKVLSLAGGRVHLFGPRDEVLARLMTGANRPTLAPQGGQGEQATSPPTSAAGGGA